MASKFTKSQPKARPRPITQALPLTDAQAVLALTTSFSAQWLFENLEELRDTTLYNGPMKFTINQLRGQLVPYLDKIIWKPITELPNADTIAAMEQQENGLEVLKTLFFVALASAHIHPGMLSLFCHDLNGLFIRYKVPATIRPDGVFEFQREGGEK